jgi:hypothetical protein
VRGLPTGEGVDTSMTIKASRTEDIAALIAALGSDDEVKRETAIARLTVIGERAVDRLVARYPDSPRPTRVAILRALEGIGDARALPVARRALLEGGELGVSAAMALRPLVQSSDARVATDTLDALVARALDATAERRVRIAAFDALSEMPDAVRQPIAKALQKDGTIGTANPGAALLDATWEDALGGQLPDRAAALRDALDGKAGSAPLSALQKLVDAVRARERDAAQPERGAWRQLRGALHEALAQRGSRIALYDLRETLVDTREPLPDSFLAALRAVGDESCLEPIAAAWGAADERGIWREHLAAAFAAIVKREKLTRRSAALKRIRAKWGALLE